MDRNGFFKDPTAKANIVRLGSTGMELLPDLKLSDLPPAGTRRWVMRRKAEVVAGVRQGLLSLEQACTRYDLSVEEFLAWQELIDRHGVRALRATRVKDYRAQQKEKDARMQEKAPTTRPYAPYIRS